MTSLSIISAWAKGQEYSNSLAQEKGKKKTSSLPPVGLTNKKQKRVEKKIVPRKKLAYEMTDEETREEVDR